MNLKTNTNEPCWRAHGSALENFCRAMQRQGHLEKHGTSDKNKINNLTDVLSIPQIKLWGRGVVRTNHQKVALWKCGNHHEKGSQRHAQGNLLYTALNQPSNCLRSYLPCLWVTPLNRQPLHLISSPPLFIRSAKKAAASLLYSLFSTWALFSSPYYSDLHCQPADNLQLLWAINRSSPAV